MEDFFQITRSAEERDITFAYRSIIRRKFQKKYIRTWWWAGGNVAPRNTLLYCLLATTSIRRYRPLFCFFWGPGKLPVAAPVRPLETGANISSV